MEQVEYCHEISRDDRMEMMSRVKYPFSNIFPLDICFVVLFASCLQISVFSILD